MSTFSKFFLILIKHLPRGVIPGAFTIVYKRNKQGYEYLVIKAKPSGNITFPGGSLNWKENFEDAARRELYEETGLKVKHLVELPVIHKFSYKNLPFKPRSEQHVFAYLITNNYRANLRSKETEWFKWVGANDVERMLTHKELTKTFKRSVRYIR